MNRIRYLRIFVYALGLTVLVVGLKWLLHAYDLEPIPQTSMHNSVISSVIFVLGFLLSATIADYKESERIPAEFASLIEDTYEDAKSLQRAYPKFSLDTMRTHLIDILESFRDGTRSKRRVARREIHDLHTTFLEMEAAGVPPNFITKLKQQQAQLLRSLFRINYIQKIDFIPSAALLARLIVVLVVGLLLLTNIDPFYSGLVLVGILSFILIYTLLIIKVIGVPFHAEGSTRDDVSLFLLEETRQHLRRDIPKDKRTK